MKSFKELLEGRPKLSGKAIISELAKTNRKKKMSSFVSKFGRGDKGLSDSQKLARIEKYIFDDHQIKKVRGLGKIKSKGVDIFNKTKSFKTDAINFEHKGIWDSINEEIINNIEDYPKDKRCSDDVRIIHAEVGNKGDMQIIGIHNDQYLNDPRTRGISTTFIFDDETSARNEILQKKHKKLQEVSDRTMAIHEDEETLDELFEADDIDTDEDKDFQM